MDLTGIDFSSWPPALVWSLCVIIVVCKLLPDALDTTAPTTRSLRP